MKVLGCSLVSLIQPFLPLSFTLSPGDDGNPCPIGKKTQRIPKVNAFLLHSKRIDIPASTTGTKAVPGLLLRINEEGGGLFSVEWA